MAHLTWLTGHLISFEQHFRYLTYKNLSLCYCRPMCPLPILPSKFNHHDSWLSIIWPKALWVINGQWHGRWRKLNCIIYQTEAWWSDTSVSKNFEWNPLNNPARWGVLTHPSSKIWNGTWHLTFKSAVCSPLKLCLWFTADCPLWCRH